ncbi:MAG: hypothetical protein RL226_1529, partial [Bacteroidota bacterium]
MKQVLFFIFFCISFALSAQRDVKDSVLFSPHFSFSYAYQFPAGDMELRFGNNSNIGIAFHVKTTKNWMYGVEWGFMTGNNVHEPGLMQNLLTADNEIIDAEGRIAEVIVMQRGYTLTIAGGKLFSFDKVNKNSGLLIKGGIGYMQHKIRLETQIHDVPQLEEEYLKGYDRLTNGLVLSQFVGYFHMGTNRLTNFYIGAEMFEGFTAGRRSYNYDTQSVDNAPRTDILFG